MQRIASLALFAFLHGDGLVHGFASPPRVAAPPAQGLRFPRTARGTFASASSTSLDTPSDDVDASAYGYEALFDFSDPERGELAVSKFDRIDDAIMGGISTSSMRLRSDIDKNNDKNKAPSFASWSGVCRLDGGGFCGTRTLPFVDGQPLVVGSDKEGLYLVVRLASDDEPERRVWKLTTRNRNNARSEQLYQAEFEIPKPSRPQPQPQPQSATDGNGAGSWVTIRVPFSTFVQVRGPRKMEGAPPLDPTGGLYQIGMSLSKFKIASNTTELADFRPGYFELQIREIGLYSSALHSSNAANTGTGEAAGTVASTADANKGGAKTVPEIRTVTKKEAEQQRPVALKLLSPVLKFFFSEQRNRRKSATRILRSRGLNRFQIALFGIRRKAAGKGIAWALGDFLGRSLASTVRLVAFWTIKLALFYPLVALRKILRKAAALVPGKPAPKNSEAQR